MAYKLTKFEIERLHGYQDIALNFLDNRMVLVGENGCGKTTVLNILYQLVTQQWEKLSKIQFEKLTLKAGNIVVKVTFEDVVDYRRHSSSRYRRRYPGLPVNILNRIERLKGTSHYEYFISGDVSDHDYAEIARLLRVPLAQLERIQRRFLQDMPKREHQIRKKLNEVINKLHKAFPEKVLYLPTYRRIESELESIFPDLYEQLHEYEDDPVHIETNKERYTEIVQFGMQDVEEQVRDSISDLKEFARHTLTSLSGTYLRDVIRGASFRRENLKKLTEDDIDKILIRVEEEILNEKDKELLKSSVKRVQDGDRTPNDLHVARYFLKLVDAINDIDQRARPINDFVSVVNRYLGSRKRVEFDPNNYELSISAKGENELDWKDLSSGEKQIVSLFSHLYLSREEGFLFFIDEPELSLSVVWQPQFLPDIVASGKCGLLFAVTHSPFIIENDLSKNSVDLQSQISEH
ncbi:MAG: AAA family ATPase [Rhodospirillales bacterium]